MRILGILNVTPDSFSDGGRYLEPWKAVRHGLQLAGDGADYVDVGGESTKPGARRVPIDIEYRRVIPVIRGLVDAGVTVSIDTTRAAIAEKAVTHGASMINDVSGGSADPGMYRVAADAGVGIVLMHSLGASGTTAHYGDVAVEVRDDLRRRIDCAVAAGVAVEKILIDPGLGFSKRPEDNWSLLQRLEVLSELNIPILIGASRKRFLQSLAAKEGAAADPLVDVATLALTSVLAATDAVWGFRVHDVRANKVAIEVATRMRNVFRPLGTC